MVMSLHKTASHSSTSATPSKTAVLFTAVDFHLQSFVKLMNFTILYYLQQRFSVTVKTGLVSLVLPWD